MRLIDADKLKNHYAWWEDSVYKNVVDDIVDAQQTVDAVPVVRCEHCKDSKTLDGQTVILGNKGTVRINFCPNCGAKMDAQEGAEG